MCFELSKEWTECPRLQRRNTDGVVTTAERLYLMGRQSIAFVKYKRAGDIVQVEFLENGNHSGNLHLDISCAGVHDVDEQVGLVQLFQCGAKASDEFFGEISNESDGIGHDDLSVLRKAESAAGSVQCLKDPISR